MPEIVYVGHTPVVSVPTFQLAEVERFVPIDVPTHVAEALTVGGTGPWVLAGTANDIDPWALADPTDDDETPEG